MQWCGGPSRVYGCVVIRNFNAAENERAAPRVFRDSTPVTPRANFNVESPLVPFNATARFFLFIRTDGLEGIMPVV